MSGNSFKETKTKSVAELLDEYVRTTKFGSNDPYISSLVKELSGVKRHSFDVSISPIISSILGPLDREEIVAHLNNASLPFDDFWIEGPALAVTYGTDDVASESNTTDAVPNSPGYVHPMFGARVKANPDKSEFTFKFISIYQVKLEGHDAWNLTADDIAKGKTFRLKRDDINKFWQRNNFLLVSEESLGITVSATDGIKFDEERLLNSLIKRSDHRKSDGTTADYSGVIDEYYETAMLLTGVFVVLGSGSLPNSFRQNRTVEDKELEEKNKNRRRMNRPQILPLNPIIIDVSDIDPKLLEPKTPQQARKLLGWTSVRRSKEIVSKHGKRFRRKPHDRRIAAAVDRRLAEREIIDRTGDVKIEIFEGRPQRVRAPSRSTQSANNDT